MKFKTFIFIPHEILKRLKLEGKVWCGSNKYICLLVWREKEKCELGKEKFVCFLKEKNN